MSDLARGGEFSVTLRFHGDLPYFLKRNERSAIVTRRLREKTSIKDVIESCGVPHTEVDLIVCRGEPVRFEFHVTADAQCDVYPLGCAPELHGDSRLQRRQHDRFVVDGHLGTVARDLRLLGFDTLYNNLATDRQLMAIVIEEDRALITRDRRLLMHAAVKHGYCPRSDRPDEQIVEVMRRFDLRPSAPYTRCMACNGLLARASKEAVLEQLEPLTKLYYEDFRQCTSCRKVYWAGSHFSKLQTRIESIHARALR